MIGKKHYLSQLCHHKNLFSWDTTLPDGLADFPLTLAVTISQGRINVSIAYFQGSQDGLLDAVRGILRWVDLESTKATTGDSCAIVRQRKVFGWYHVVLAAQAALERITFQAHFVVGPRKWMYKK